MARSYRRSNRARSEFAINGGSYPHMLQVRAARCFYYSGVGCASARRAVLPDQDASE